MENSSLRPRELSILIPVHDERDNIRPLFDEIRVSLAPTVSYEVVFCDDGSTDGTEEVLEALHRTFPEQIRVVTLRKRFGKTEAIAAGLSIARGERILTMDGDGQDVSADIPRLLAKLDEGFDMVCGWRKRREDALPKRLTSMLFNSATRLVSGLSLRDFNCGFKLYRREALASIRLCAGSHRYLPVLIHQQGFRIGEISVGHRPRRSGRSKYGAARFHQGFLDLLSVVFITRFLLRPLHLFGTLGFLMAGIGFAIDGYLTWLWLHGRGIGNRPLLLLGNLLIALGIQIVLIGLIGEMVARFLHSGEKAYAVKRIL